MEDLLPSEEEKEKNLTRNPKFLPLNGEFLHYKWEKEWATHFSKEYL